MSLLHLEDAFIHGTEPTDLEVLFNPSISLTIAACSAAHDFLLLIYFLKCKEDRLIKGILFGEMCYDLSSTNYVGKKGKVYVCLIYTTFNILQTVVTEHGFGKYKIGCFVNF